MRNKRLQGLVTAGRWTLPAAIFICTLCWVLTSVLLPELTMTAGEERRFRALAVCPHVAAPRMGGASCQFLDLRGYRLFPDRAEQPVQYYPYAGFRADSYLFSAGHRLSGDAPAICRKRCRHNLLSPSISCSRVTSRRRRQDICSTRSCLSVQGAFSFPSLTFFSVLWLFEAHRFQSLTFRSFCGALIGWTMPYWMLFGHAFSMIRWSCSIILSKSWPLLGTYSTYRYSSRGNWRLSVICLYCSSSAPLIASLPDSKIRYARAPIYSFS